MSRYAAAGFALSRRALVLGDLGKRRTVQCVVLWHEGRPSQSPVALARDLGRYPGVAAIEWRPS